MGFFKEIEIEVIDRVSEGMSDTQIATDLKLPLDEVRRIMAAMYGMDYDESDTDMVSYDDLEFDPGDVDYNAEHY